MIESTALLTKHKNKLLNAGVILLTLIILVNIFKSQNQSVGVLRAEKDLESNKNEVFSNISQAEKRLATYKNIFSKKDPAHLINLLSSIARDSSVKIIAINPRPQESRQVYIKYPFDLTVGVDNYHAIGKFASSIENSNEIFFIDKATIKPMEKSLTSENKYSLMVGLTISAIALKN
jgi:Tfp pilus assembly protein PilO